MCAHVVATVLRADPYAATTPPGRLRIGFPLLGEGDSTVEAEVSGWVPIEEDGSGDVAVLRLIDDHVAGHPNRGGVYGVTTGGRHRFT